MTKTLLEKFQDAYPDRHIDSFAEWDEDGLPVSISKELKDLCEGHSREEIGEFLELLRPTETPFMSNLGKTFH